VAGVGHPRRVRFPCTSAICFSPGKEIVMFGIGMPELIVILVIAILVFGATRLPEIGSGVGKAIRNFKKSIKEPPEIDVTPTEEDKEIESKKKKKK
jgi:sec-independent protein translocase protein TatA